MKAQGDPTNKKVKASGIKYTSLKEEVLIQLHVKRVDNRVVFSLTTSDGKTQNVYDSGHIDNDPPMDDITTLNSFLRPGVNILAFTLYNDPYPQSPNKNPWHLKFDLIAVGLDGHGHEIPLWSREKSSNNNQLGAVWSDQFQITV
jgi:hypothetical protein